MKVQTDNLGKVSITVEKDYWNINKCYDKLVAVEREGYGAYLSRKPVPEGIYIDNREYWIRLSFPGSSGSVNLVQTLGYDAGVAISQKAITEKFDEIEAILNDIISGGVITTVTFNPPSVPVNESTEIIIGVEVNIEADKISIFRGNVKIGEQSGTVYSVNDTITPNSDLPIIYRVKVEKNGKIVSDVTATLPIDKANGLVKWMRGGNEVTEDTVTVLETGHTYPALYNPDELTPISYTSSNTSVARVTKVNDYSYKIDIVSFGSTDIHAIFSGDATYNAIDTAYKLVVSKVDYEDFVWTDPQTGNSIMDDPTWEINKSNLPNVVYPVLKRTGDRGTVTYSTSPEQSNIASINSVTGNITLGTALGTVVINAQFSGDNTYEAKTVSYSLIVQQQSEVYWTVGGEKKANGYTFTYIVTNLPYQQVKFNFPSGTSFNYDVYDVSGGEYHAPISAEVTVDVNTGVATLPTETHIGYNDKYKVTAWSSTGSKANDGVSIIINPIRGERTFEWDEKIKEVYMGTLVEGEYIIPANELPKIINGTYGEITRIEQATGHSSPIVTIDKDNTGYTVKVTDNVVSPMEIWVRALSAMNTLYNAHADTYKLTILPPATPDYYVGYTKGNNAYDRVEQGSIEQIITMSEYNGSKPSSCTKTVSAEEACDPSERVDLPVLFIMWKEGCAPTGGSYDWGFGSQTFRSADFVDDTIFNIQRDIVDSNDITWHLAGRSDKFYEDYTTTVNF